MDVRLIVRLLDKEVRLLGWCELAARMPGDGTIRALSEVLLEVEAGGVPAFVSIHWPDANIEARMPSVDVAPVVEKQVLVLDWRPDPVLELGRPPVDLPMVTIRKPIVLTPPAGGFEGFGVVSASMPKIEVGSSLSGAT